MNDNSNVKLEKLLINNELLNIIRRAAATKGDYDLAQVVRIVLEIPNKEER